MSADLDSVEYVIERWGREQVLGLAPDPASQKAAGGVARPAKWVGTGCDEQAVWGDCQGSGKSAYRAAVDLSEPAFRCSCPSRKFPCKHALGLLLLWSDATIAAATTRPDWVDEWLTQRRERAAKAQERRQTAAAGTPEAGSSTTGAGTTGAGTTGAGTTGSAATRTTDPRTAARREQRVDDGVEELDQWLCDQVTHGLARAEKAPYTLWDDMARRLVDAQAGTLASQVKELAAITRGGEGWPERLLEEYALLRLLTTAHRRRADLPEPLRATIRSRIGFTVHQDEVLRGDRIRDRWYVAGCYDTERDRLVTRRVWLRGQRSGGAALVLSFAAVGRALDASLVVGHTIDAELVFYPGAQPLRALVAERYGAPAVEAPRGTTIGGLLAEYATALSADPWLDRWPAVLENVRLSRADARGRPQVVDVDGAAVPLSTTDVWRLLAVSGGGPITVAGEWSPDGLRPLSAWHEEEGVIVS
jgi:SWIM zinc finger